MDDNGASMDDQGSGWFQVKKKHRSSSKFSIQNWVGGFSRQQVNVKGQGQGQGQTSNVKYRSSISRPEKDITQKGVSSHSSSSKQHEPDEQCLDKRVVNDDNGRPKTPPLKIITTTTSQSASIPQEHVSEKKHDIVHRIKWGNLEDDALGPDCGTTSLSEIRFGEIGDDDLAMCGTSRNICDLNVCNLSKESSVVSKDKVEEKYCKEVNEVALTNSIKVVDDLAIGDVETLNEDHLQTEGPEKIVDISSSIVNPDVNDSDLSAIKDKDENGEGMVGSLEPLEDGNVGPNISGVKEPEEGESKERFRERLWCFLFENLNRSIDELYLLCELECDLGQVKESILVLQEAESDFRELKIRVEEFETLKNSSGAVMSIKGGDHRRPHALSWEVRRMTTSPHRAEILSSSLEAFKKIQQERAKERVSGESSNSHSLPPTIDHIEKSIVHDTPELETKSRRKSGISEPNRSTTSRERRNIETGRSGKNSVQNSRISLVTNPTSEANTNKLPPRGSFTPSLSAKSKKELPGSSTEMDKDKLPEGETFKKINVSSDREREKDKRYSQPWKPVDAWKEKRNWEEILAPPSRFSSRTSHSPCMSRRSAERARVLHDKLMSPEKKKKTALDLKKEAEEKHARAMRIRSELENERVQKLQRTSEKLSRVSKWNAIRSMKLREGMYARHQRSESRHEAYIAQVVKRAGDESIKVNEVRFITSLNEENKKFMLHQKLQGSEMRRNEKIQVMKTKQKEDMAREEAVIERRKLIEAEKLQRLVETQRRKEEAQLRREEERKASSAAREARTMEQLRRKEERAKAQQEEAELLAQRLAERLSESEQRRKVYLEQIRERASMDFRDQLSPLMRRLVNKEGQGKSTPPLNGEDNQANSPLEDGESGVSNSVKMQQSLKRRIKKIRQRLMALKHEVPEPPGGENVGIGYRTSMATSRAKIGRWIQDLQRLRQERKEGAASIGLISAEMIKFLEGKELELQASRQAGLLDFISSALPASHISKPEACQVTIYLLRLLKVVLSVPTNRNYFLSQNLLPPLIPMLSAALESYIKITASLNGPTINNSHQSKISTESFDSISEVLDGFLWISTMIIGLPTCDKRQCQMQDGLLELIVSYQIIHRLRDLFALYDRPPVEGSPFPESILLSIKLLVVLTSKPCVLSSFYWENEEVYDFAKIRNFNRQLAPDCDVSEVSCKEKEEQCNESHDTKILNDPNISQDEKSSVLNIIGKNNGEQMGIKQPYVFLLSAISETGLVSLLSLLTAVLLQANNRLSSEQGSYVLPSNFVEVATGVLKVLNNLGLTDIAFMQKMLAMPDLKMEFFHIMSFLLSHCTNNWKVASDQVGLLLFESVMLLGYFSLFHPGNQAVLRWGNTPTILHKVCDLPFAFFSDLELMPILAGTLVAVCFGCEQNKAVVQQELSTEMIVSLVKSWKTSLTSVQSKSTPSMEESTESSLLTLERKKVQTEVTTKSARSTSRGSRLSLSKGSLSGNTNARIGKIRNYREGKASKVAEDSSLKIKSLVSSESPTTMPFYCRFPPSFIDKAEQFFSHNSNGVDEPTCLTSY